MALRNIFNLKNSITKNSITTNSITTNSIVRNSIVRNIIGARHYHQKVIEHFENPKNIGKLDKDDPNVGTGLVGAPACIHEDTKIAVADGRRIMTVKDLYLENKIVQVWSYNIEKDIYEIKNAILIKNIQDIWVFSRKCKNCNS